MQERLGVPVQQTVGVLLRNAARKQILIKRRRLFRRVQTLRQRRAVEIRPKRQIFSAAQREKMHHMAVNVVKALDFSIVSQEGRIIVQSDQAAAPDHFRNLRVRQVPFVRTARGHWNARQ